MALSHQDQLRCVLHARLPAFERRVARAEAIITEALAQMRTPYLAFSGGVDSTALLDLVWRQAPGIAVLFGDDGWDYPETLAFLAATEQRYGFHLRRVRCLDPWRAWCEEMDAPELVDAPNAGWGNPLVWDDTWRSLAKDAHAYGGYYGVLLGMLGTEWKRGGESTQRWHTLAGGTRPLYQLADGMWHCSPLASWTKQDIWAYIVSRDLPYNAAYDVLARLGIPMERRRVAPLTCFRTAQFGSVVTLKAGWPHLYNRLASVFPRVRSYA